MKKLFVVLIVMISGHLAQAGECYEFNVQGHSKGLKRISVRMVGSVWTRHADAVVTAVSKGKKVETVFQCLRGRNSTFCTQPDGGGDFSIQRDKISKITLSYINLVIGAKSNGAKDGEEIDEEFAVLDAANSEESEENGGELKPVSISGRAVRCLAAGK